MFRSDTIRRLSGRRDLLRRHVLSGGVAAAGLAVAPAGADPVSNQPPHIPPWMRRPGGPVVNNSYGLPSRYEREVVRRTPKDYPFPGAAESGAPLQDLHGIITPNGLHYERDHAGVPDIDPAAHRLLVHGLVQRPLIFTVADLMRFPAVSRTHFLECSGNSWYFWEPDKVKPGFTVQHTHGLLSCAEWTGVRVADVFAEAGVRPEVKWVLAEGADSAAMTRSIPMAKMLDDAILAYAQNGERLRPEQGYPLRLFLPGYEGNTNVKWLRRLKLGAVPFETRDETASYTELLPNGRALQFFLVMEAKSVVTRPSGGQRLAGPGFHEISGIAWSGYGRIRTVDVSTDGGATWHGAALQEPVLTKCLTRFRLPWTWDGKPAVLMSRATDETGYVQPTRAALVAARGAKGHYHYNGIVGWRIDAEGTVSVAV